MRITRNHLHDPDLFATYLIIDHRVIVAVFVFAHLAQLDQSVSVHHHELFVLRVMPVLALGDTRFGDIHRELPPVSSADNLREASPRIRIHLQVVSEPVGRKVRQIGRIEFLGKTVFRRVGNLQRFGHSPERMQQIYDPTQCNPVRCGDITEIPVTVFIARKRSD